MNGCVVCHALTSRALCQAHARELLQICLRALDDPEGREIGLRGVQYLLTYYLIKGD